MKVIQLSDIHLTTENNDSLYGINPYYRLKTAFKSIHKHHSDADFVVITGDLTDCASPEAYAFLKKTLDKSKLPVYPILGNHDKRKIFSNYFPNIFNDGFVQYVKKIDDSVHIFLDTLVEGKSYGELCSVRLNWLEDRLKEHSNEYVYLYMHHHPIYSGLHEMDNDADFRTIESFWSLLKNHNNVKHISFGHLHRIMHSSRQNISLHSTRSTVFQVSYQPNSKVEHLTNEEQPTYAIIEVADEGNTRIHHHEFMNEDGFYLGNY